MKSYIHRLVLLSAAFLALGSWARAPAPQPLTLLVIPERINLVNISFDLLDKRPVALATYRSGPDGRPVVYAWTGTEWIEVPMNEYRGGAFLVRQPDRIILVGDDQLLPVELVDASDWGPMVLSVATTESDDFLNAMGQSFEFTSAEWRWFSRRYNMALEDVTPPSEGVSWYDQMTRTRQLPPRRHDQAVPVLEPVEPVAEPRPMMIEGYEPPMEPIPRPAVEPPGKGTGTDSLRERHLIK